RQDGNAFVNDFADGFGKLPKFLKIDRQDIGIGIGIDIGSIPIEAIAPIGSTGKNLNWLVTFAWLQNFRTIELRRFYNTTDFVSKLRKFLIQETTFPIANGIRSRLSRKLAHPHDDIGSLVKATFCYLNVGDTVTGITLGD